MFGDSYKFLRSGLSPSSISNKDVIHDNLYKMVRTKVYLNFQKVQYDTMHCLTSQYNSIPYTDNAIQHNTIQYNTKRNNTIKYNTI